MRLSQATLQLRSRNEDLERLVEVEVDGRRLDRAMHHLAPGSRIAITDRRTGERESMSIDAAINRLAADR